MMLIYDNCMKFNPSTGVNKWIYDAAESNKAKYVKMYVNVLSVSMVFSWNSSQGKISRFVVKQNDEPKDSYGSASMETYTPAYVNDGSFDNNDAYVVTQSHAEVSPSKPQVLKFRLSLSQIQDYKARLAFHEKLQSSQDHVAESMPPPEVVMGDPEAETTPVEPAPSMTDAPTEEPGEAQLGNDRVFFDDPGSLSEVDADETSTAAESHLDNMPAIASRREDGILRVNWLSENECNQLFPHCSIIGLHQGKLHYNVSDVGLRSIYNELYMSGKSSRTDSSKRERLEETATEDYTMKHHKMISFLLDQPEQDTGPTRCNLSEFGDGDSISITDEEVSLPSTIDHETSYESSVGNTVAGDYADENEFVHHQNMQTLHVKLTTEATVGIGVEAERVLLKNGFIRVRAKNSTIKCCPELSFTSELGGYYKADESAFIYRNTILRHLRLFLVNCGKVQVELSRRCLPLAELILDHGTESEVYDLFLESKKRRSRNLAFFQLPNSGKASYSRSMDVIWRLQTVVNALPTPFLVLHVICRDTN